MIKILPGLQILSTSSKILKTNTLRIPTKLKARHGKRSNGMTCRMVSSIINQFYQITLFCIHIEHFIVWMRTAGLPNFRKLWGSIKGGLTEGAYFVSIKNKYEVKPFQGTKSFVLSTTNALGGKNYFLAVCYITVGTLCLLFSFVFCFAYMKK